jgi:MutS domain V
MSEIIVPENFYQQRIESLSAILISLNKRKNWLGWLRLLIVGAGAAVLYFLWPLALWASLLISIITVVLFLIVLNLDLSNRDSISHHERLLELNKQEVLHLQHQFSQKPDGHEFFDEEDSFAGDLDIFGRSSMYQYINRSCSQQGNKILSNWLMNAAVEQEILSRQKAVQELSRQTDWRQELQAHSSTSVISFAGQEAIQSWLKEMNTFGKATYWQIIRYLVPALAITALLSYLFDLVDTPQFLILLLIFSITASYISRKVNPFYRKLSKIAVETNTLFRIITCIENASFQDPLLSELKKQFRSETKKASKQVKELNGILNRFDYRLNPIVFIPLNIFLLWDLQQILQLEKWKKQNNQEVSHWFDAMAKFEVLSSMGTLAFNHPDWCFPILNSDQPEFTATRLRHPLIKPTSSVANDFSTIGQGKINIITGSNMAGKSTFLRSVGVNMVLATMGAPVCASAMTVSPLKVMSSMRIKDNLEESTSTFYAELKKLKTIIDAVNSGQPVFILLDEILRGTNSLDRHTGSMALIRQLLKHNATGIVATHDLELAGMSQEFPQGIHNYYFDAALDGEELYFDYTLKQGVCQNLNASILMKKIGIEL